MILFTAMVIHLAPRILQGTNHDEEGQHHLHEAGQIQEDVTLTPAQDALVDPALVDEPDQGDDQLDGGQDVENKTPGWERYLTVFVACFTIVAILCFALFDFWTRRSVIKNDFTFPRCKLYTVDHYAAAIGIMS